jgi:hypothetical protein
MIKKHTVGFGAITGLMIGVIVFVVGISSASAPDTFVLRAINAIQVPLIPVVAWMQGAAHNWGSNNSGLYKLLIVIMGYWMLLGALIGFGCRLVLGRRASNTA